MVDADRETVPSQRELELMALDDTQRTEAVAKALGSQTRLEILHYLGAHTCSVLEIAEALSLPASTATLHVNILEKAGLIKTDLRPATRGLQKICARAYDRISFQLPARYEPNDELVDISMPIGAFVDARVEPTCGLVGDNGIIGHFDDPGAFYEPERMYAQLLWFRCGFVEYRFPNRLPPGTSVYSIEASFEICSEAPLHHDDWPSDITVWINGVEIGTWTSPADFGGERGSLTPLWWDTTNTQYGLLKVWKVTQQGSFIDGIRISDVGMKDLKLKNGDPLSMRIGIKEDAQKIGGINLFGSKFGNYPQDILLKLRYKHVERKT
ncbi:MAG: helix-turn-helix domain-containing protein [Anaerolineaceae bacterium]|nr:helix-turn-helix domain-containing protein [Anaerolineaceae bacterium]